MKLIVAGGRGFNDEPLMRKELNRICKDISVEIVSGMAKGADLLAYNLAKSNNIPVKEFHANWQDMSEPCVTGHNSYGTYNKLAGHKRNHQMGDYADILIAFWDGKSAGTKEMIEYMTTLNKPVHVIKY